MICKCINNYEPRETWTHEHWLINISLKIENYYYQSPSEQSLTDIFQSIDQFGEYITDQPEPRDTAVSTPTREEKLQQISQLREEYIGKNAQLLQLNIALSNLEDSLNLLKKLE